MPNRITVTDNHQLFEAGCPASSLPQIAERVSRALLAERGYPRLGGRR